MKLDETTLRTLGDLRDRLGVLSIYVDADPERQAARTPPWEIAIRQRLRELRAWAREEEPRARSQALARRLDALEPELADFLSARTRGRGRALFAALGDDAVHRLSIQLPLPTVVTIDERAHLEPLRVALRDGRQVGIAIVSRADVRVLEWRLGEVEELASPEFVAGVNEWRELRGPVSSNPGFPQRAARRLKRFRRRLEAGHTRFLNRVGAQLETLAAERAWQEILLAGDSRLTRALADALPERGNLRLIPIQRSLEGLSERDLAGAVAEEVAEIRSEVRSPRATSL